MKERKIRKTVRLDPVSDQKVKKMTDLDNERRRQLNQNMIYENDTVIECINYRYHNLYEQQDDNESADSDMALDIVSRQMEKYHSSIMSTLEMIAEQMNIQSVCIRMLLNSNNYLSDLDSYNLRNMAKYLLNEDETIRKIVNDYNDKLLARQKKENRTDDPDFFDEEERKLF